MNGILNILKPPGMTSHDVVALLRKLWGIKRIGHTGTLDPAAAGVLVLLIGKATKLNQYMVGMDKVYRGQITFGVRTNTQDSTGTVIERIAPVITREQVESAFAKFTGTQTQIPPLMSAVKHKGKRLYKWAQQDVEVVAAPRAISIYTLHLLAFSAGTGEGNDYPSAFFECHCSKGTYIRTLAADIGDYLGCGAHLSFLLRTQVGPFKLEKSLTLEEIAAADLSHSLLPLTAGLSHLTRVIVKSEAVKALINGKSLRLSDVEPVADTISTGQFVRLERPDGALLAIATWEGGSAGDYFRPRQVLYG
jgi:tRNA pseudouridine55 synthase